MLKKYHDNSKKLSLKIISFIIKDINIFLKLKYTYVYYKLNMTFLSASQFGYNKKLEPNSRNL